jgi:carboxypeptidase PM20D1
MKAFVKYFLMALAVLLLVVLAKTWLLKTKQMAVQTIVKNEFDKNANEHLAQAIRIETISYDDSLLFKPQAFIQFINFVKKTYPTIASQLNFEIVNKYSLLIEWKGKSDSLSPIILMGHYDVVPVEEASRKQWEYPAFSGFISKKFIHGRGSLDDKVAVIAILESVEKLLNKGFEPERSIIMAFGHDEELGGNMGAKAIAAILRERNIQAEFILDEGLVITDGIVPGLKAPAALIGIAEKGYATATLTAKVDGGHSSMPKKENAIAVLSEALVKLKNNPMTSKISEPVQFFINDIGPELSFVNKMAFANQWLFEKLIIQKYQATNTGNALVTSTSAATLLQSGMKENVIPMIAKATINFRLLPGDDDKTVRDYLKNTIADDRIEISISEDFSPATSISPIDNKAYKAISKTIKEVFNNTIVAPSLMIAATDQKHYTGISENRYRFLPVQLDATALKGIHGINEKVGIDNYQLIIQFYEQLIQNACINTL